MIIVFLGPPGAGKGTQCKALVANYGLGHLSSGDLLRKERKENTKLGQEAQGYMDRGDLVPDDLIVAMMIGAMNQSQAQGYILDGFPRTLGQAEALDGALRQEGRQVDLVLNLVVDDQLLEERVTGRRSCPHCGAVYHVKYLPPKEDDICDQCGTRLVQRPDDKPEVVRNRIKTYREQTAPLIDYYSQQGNLQNLDGNASIEAVNEQLFSIMDSQMPRT